MTKIAELIEAAHENAFEKGFWNSSLALDRAHFQNGLDPEQATELRNALIVQKLALISTEIAEFEDEAYVVMRTRSREAMLEELADIVIRVFDLCGFIEEPLDEDVLTMRLHEYSTATGVARAMYREVAVAVQSHRKGRHDFPMRLQQIVRYAQDFASSEYSEPYALRRAVIAKMEKNQSREHKHGAAY